MEHMVMRPRPADLFCATPTTTTCLPNLAILLIITHSLSPFVGGGVVFCLE